LKILSLTISAGKGHQKAAEAVKEYYIRNNIQVEFEMIDALKYINPIVDKLIIGGYLKSLKKTPKLYGKLYYYSENEDALASISNLIHDLFSIKLKNLLEEMMPDVILCTHPFAIEMMSILKRKGKTNIPVAAILTDYAPHPFWIHEYIDAYIIPNEDFLDDLLNLGVAKENIYPIGIPVSSAFLTEIPKKEAREILQLEDKLTLLLMGGGLGIGNIKEIFEKLIFSNLDIQIIAVTGYNTILKNQLLNLSLKSNKKTKILGYTDKVNLLMSASDLLITKPGGLTISEALVKGLPLILSNPIPGQEEKNTEYLLNCGIAAYVKKVDSIPSIINQIISSPLRLKYMQDMAKEKSKPNAAKDVGDLLIKMAKKEFI